MGVESIIGAIIFGMGLVVGSFLNAVIYRLPRGIDIVWGRSFCPKCKKKIKWFDNVPLVSFLLLRGYCRHCHSPISFRYPIVELITGLLTLLIFNFKFLILNQFLNLNFQTIFNLVLALIVVWSLIVVFFIDLEHQIIPDVIVLPLIVLFTLFYFIFYPRLLISNYLITGVFSALFLFLIFLATKGKGMGFGDVKLAFLLGLILGFPKVVICFYLAFLTGGIIGIILILAKKVSLKQKIAFGPFLVLGTLIAFLWGDPIINLVQKLFF